VTAALVAPPEPAELVEPPAAAQVRPLLQAPAAAMQLLVMDPVDSDLVAAQVPARARTTPAMQTVEQQMAAETPLLQATTP
jgi:hypothetical protein